MARSSPLRANMERHCLTRSVRSLPLLRAFSISRHAHLYQVAAQNFEYKMSNILDKPLCVSITIANRIFSDYFRRHQGICVWVYYGAARCVQCVPVYCVAERRAWRGSTTEVFPWRDFGASWTPLPTFPHTQNIHVPQHGAGADIFTANMYLAEDRVSIIYR